MPEKCEINPCPVLAPGKYFSVIRGHPFREDTKIYAQLFADSRGFFAVLVVLSYKNDASKTGIGIRAVYSTSAFEIQ